MHLATLSTFVAAGVALAQEVAQEGAAAAAPRDPMITPAPVVRPRQSWEDVVSSAKDKASSYHEQARTVEQQFHKRQVGQAARDAAHDAAAKARELADMVGRRQSWQDIVSSAEEQASSYEQEHNNNSNSQNTATRAAAAAGKRQDWHEIVSSAKDKASSYEQSHTAAARRFDAAEIGAEVRDSARDLALMARDILAHALVAARDWRDDVSSAESLASSYASSAESAGESWESYASTVVDDVLSSVSDVVSSAESVASTATGSALSEASEAVSSAQSLASSYESQYGGAEPTGDNDNGDGDGDGDSDSDNGNNNGENNNNSGEGTETQEGAAPGNSEMPAMLSMGVAMGAVLFGAVML